MCSTCDIRDVDQKLKKSNIMSSVFVLQMWTNDLKKLNSAPDIFLKVYIWRF